jgi:hypothetical protein
MSRPVILTRWSTPHHPIFKVGDRVLVPWSPEMKIPAVVIEDRGPLGGGKQIVRVRLLTDIIAPYEEGEFRAEELERDPNPS